MHASALYSNLTACRAGSKTSKILSKAPARRSVRSYLTFSVEARNCSWLSTLTHCCSWSCNSVSSRSTVVWSTGCAKFAEKSVLVRVSNGMEPKALHSAPFRLPVDCKLKVITAPGLHQQAMYPCTGYKNSTLNEALTSLRKSSGNNMKPNAPSRTISILSWR